VDCVLFGFVSIAKFSPLTDEDMLKDHPNLSKYVDRIKQRAFPDWEDLIQEK
jgi:glutathione S-transferase